MQYNAMQYNAIQCNIMQYNAMQYNSMQFIALVDFTYKWFILTVINCHELILQNNPFVT